MDKIILIRYSEIHLKGKNRGFFEKLLQRNIENAVSAFECKVSRSAGRYYIKDIQEAHLDSIINLLKDIFGIYSFSVATQIETSLENLKTFASNIKLDENATFKITVNRANKNFELDSMELARVLGGEVLKNNKNLKVDLFTPEHNISFDIRENGVTNVFEKSYMGAGGMPVGSAGKGMLLLSGGIDSPVAGYQIAKRGMAINGVHFHSYPYTSNEAKEKVISLAKLIKHYTGKKKLYMVNFTKIQEEIHKNCESSYMITIMRRIMLMIAEKVARNDNSKAVITGESLGQVASQTIESITVTNAAMRKMPVLRPLISSDKEEIIHISKKINTYETSILPFEDCCTVFLPKFPIIKPDLEFSLNEEKKLDITQLVATAMKNIEIIKI